MGVSVEEMPQKLPIANMRALQKAEGWPNLASITFHHAGVQMGRDSFIYRAACG